MPPKSWKDYVPRYVSLYYVDYNENLDSREDLQERCIRRNSLHPLEEQVWEWYAEQGHTAVTRHARAACGESI